MLLGLFRQTRGEESHQLGLLLVECLERDLAGVVLLVHGRDPLDQLVRGGGVLVEGARLGLVGVVGPVLAPFPLRGGLRLLVPLALSLARSGASSCHLDLLIRRRERRTRRRALAR